MSICCSLAGVSSHYRPCTTHTLWVVLWEANHTWLMASVQTSVISCIVVWRLMIQHPECLSDYVTALHEKWNARPQQSNQLVNSMRSHCQAVINAQGHVRSYWDVDIFVVEYPLRLLAVWEEGITSSSAQICWIRPVFPLDTVLEKLWPSHIAITIQVYLMVSQKTCCMFQFLCYFRSVLSVLGASLLSVSTFNILIGSCLL